MTSRQFYIMLSLIVISLKIQKMPCIISDILSKDGYVLILLYFLVDIVLISIAFFIAKQTRGKSFNFNNVTLNIFKKILLIFVSIYFLMLGVLYYETVQDLFSHILFDNLPWSLFSLLLIALVFYLANTGIKNIALNFELYAVIIYVSLIIIMIFGFTRTDFTSILPLCTIDFSKAINMFMSFNFWFGDFFFVLLMAREAKDAKFKWTMLVYVVSMLVVVLLDIEFYGIYLSYASLQPSLISVISEQSMLGIGVGRIDWFLILIAEAGTILSSGVCLYYSKKSLSNAFPKVKEGWLLAGLMLVLYLLDVLLLVDTHIKVLVYTKYLSYFGAVIKALVIIIGLVIAIICKKNSKQNEKEKSNTNLSQSPQSQKLDTIKPSKAEAKNIVSKKIKGKQVKT